MEKDQNTNSENQSNETEELKGNELNNDAQPDTLENNKLSSDAQSDTLESNETQKETTPEDKILELEDKLANLSSSSKILSSGVVSF